MVSSSSTNAGSGLRRCNASGGGSGGRSSSGSRRGTRGTMGRDGAGEAAERGPQWPGNGNACGTGLAHADASTRSTGRQKGEWRRFTRVDGLDGLDVAGYAWVFGESVCLCVCVCLLSVRLSLCSLYVQLLPVRLLSGVSLAACHRSPLDARRSTLDARRWTLDAAPPGRSMLPAAGQAARHGSIHGCGYI
jgi:hypothetical protein